MDWTRWATINEQTDGTTADNRVLINFLPTRAEAPAVELISNTQGSSFSSARLVLNTQVTFVGRDGVTFKYICIYPRYS